jgi:hypothetical protein
MSGSTNRRWTIRGAPVSGIKVASETSRSFIEFGSGELIRVKRVSSLPGYAYAWQGDATRFALSDARRKAALPLTVDGSSRKYRLRKTMLRPCTDLEIVDTPLDQLMTSTVNINFELTRNGYIPPTVCFACLPP